MKWKSIESAPTNGELVIVWKPGKMPYVASFHGDEWVSEHSAYRKNRLIPTHWLTVVPKAPKIMKEATK